MRFFEYRSEKIDVDPYRGDSYTQNRLQKELNEWGKEGWEVLSVFVPDHRNYSTYVVTAKREILEKRTPATGRKFR